MTLSVAREPMEVPAHGAGQPLRRAGASALRADERLWLLGLSIVMLCSLGRWLATGSLKVDESYPSETIGTLLLVALGCGYGLLVLGWKGLLERPLENPRRLAFTGVAVAALMLPMLSNDVFSMFAYGSLAAHGQDVYTSAGALQGSAWYAWIGAHWIGSVCVYGPSTLLSILPMSLADGHPWLAMLVIRVAWLVPLAIVMELSFRRLRTRPFFHAMVWMNPLFLLEGPGQLHADLLAVIALTAGILLQERGNLKSGWAMYGLALLGKYSFALTGSWFWLSGTRTMRDRALRVPGILAVVASLAVACFTPFWRGIATITTPLRTLASMNPGGTLTEVFGDIVHFARGGASAPPDAPVAQVAAHERLTHGTSWLVASLVLGIVALSIAVRVLRAMLRKPSDEKTIALGTGVLVVVVATIASRRFEPWYLMAALPFFGLGCSDEWRRWWVAAVATSVAPTFINVLPRTASILPAWSILTTVAMMIVFVSSFRSRYFSFGGESVERTEERSTGLLGIAEG
jgi:hypothetical protein